MRHIIPVIASLLVAAAAAASEVDVSAGATDASNRHFGSLTPTNWRFHDERGVTLGVDWFLHPNVSVDTDIAEVREHVRYEGARTAALRAVPASFIVQFHAPDGPVRPYIGSGVSYLMYRDVVRSPFGVPAQPDHAAAVVGGGTDFAVSGHWMLNVDAKYGPARSTAEVLRRDGSAEKIDFHQMYVSTRVRYRF